MLEPLLVQISWWANTFEQELPEYWSAVLRSGAVLPERGRRATPGSWPGALSERRSRKRPERTWSAGAPTALQQTVKFIGTQQKFCAARSLF